MYVLFIEGVIVSVVWLCWFVYNDYIYLFVLLLKIIFFYWLIVLEGVFSMDGDLLDVVKLVVSVEVFDSWLMLDDVYVFGVIGEYGLGSIDVY